jgi:CubicO group peptidase (beta-lactamase class C family)
MYNAPEVRALGVPGGGGVMRAADLALFYQALLHNSAGIWDPAVLADATSRVRNNLPERWMRVTANRALGVVVAGDDGRANVRGFGHTGSPSTFGHNGAGGQIAWADPESGISFAYVTNGMDQHVIRQARRGIALSSLAAVC